MSGIRRKGRKMKLIHSNEKHYKAARRREKAKMFHERDKKRFYKCPRCGSKYEYSYQDMIKNGGKYDDDGFSEVDSYFYIGHCCEVCHGWIPHMSCYIDKETGNFVKER